MKKSMSIGSFMFSLEHCTHSIRPNVLNIQLIAKIRVLIFPFKTMFVFVVHLHVFV